LSSRPTDHASSHYDAHVAQRWMTLTLPYVLERTGLDLRRTAIVFAGEVRTYGVMRSYARRVGNALVADGLESLERVAVLSSNRLEYLEVEIGIAMARGIMVPMNWRLRKPELITLLRRSEARVIVAEDRFVSVIREILAEGAVPSLRQVVVLGEPADEFDSYETWCAASQDEPLHRGGLQHDPHEIIFTSGTTGTPKGAIWTNDTVMFNAWQQVMDFELTKRDSCYVLTDLYYIGGRHDFTWALLYQGGTVHIRKSSGFSAEPIVQYVVDHSISHVLWVPTMLYEILRLPNLGEMDTSRLRMIMCGGAPVPRATIEMAQAFMPETDFVQVYGLTEGGGTVTFLPPEFARDRVGSAGPASMNNTLRIVDALGNDCPAGTRGEIIVMGPSVTAGYWDEPELTAATVVDGWLHTGDQGYVDDDGFLFVSGRIKDMIISGGMNIFPSEIEETLIEHPDIAAVAVIGVPDERWGERVHAVVQLLPGRSLSEADVIAYCTERIAGFKKPQSVVFVEEFPRTASGKIQKYMLRRSGHDTGSAS